MPPDLNSSNKKTYTADNKSYYRQGKNHQINIPLKMNIKPRARAETNSINFYIFLSTLVHMTILLFTGVNNDVTLGDKIIPIEILDIPSIANRGEYFQKNQKQGAKDIREIIKKDKESKKEVQEEIRKEDKDLNINEESKRIQKQEKIITSSDSGINKERGGEGKSNKYEVEKGSLKGKGIEKITCLSCLKPKYPKLALKRGYEGILKLRILISKSGDVVDIKILKSSGYTILDKSGIAAAKNSKFYPLKKEGIINLEYNLKLNR